MLLTKSYKKGIFITMSLTTMVLVFFLWNDYQGLKNYLGYTVDKGRSAIFAEEYINQKIALNLIKSFSISEYKNKKADSSTLSICSRMESINDIYGLNLTGHKYPKLAGTLQTKNSSCEDWARDIKYLAKFNSQEEAISQEYSFSNYHWKVQDSIRYYIDFENQYIYINKLVDSSRYAFNNWLRYNGKFIDVDSNARSIKIDDEALRSLHDGQSVTSHIYDDGYTGEKIISMITPLFFGGNLKGIIVTDVSINELAKAFYTFDRPFLWKYLTLSVIDRNSSEEINFNQPDKQLFGVLNYDKDITLYYTVHLKLDVQYFILNNLFLFILYIFITYSICKYLKYQISKNEVLSLENITDSMTGLYNRKILTQTLDARLKSLIEKNTPVTIIALDCDKLKTINDTLGHHMGDKAITLLGDAIQTSIRKSDYGIRLGGDEFCIILIDCDVERAFITIDLIKQKLKVIDTDAIVNFSYGCYQMKSGDTLSGAQIIADELLYKHKKTKG
ncbi:GGDEF domain-containing protein [Hafnia alvei]|uniref:diguanylate cyclase DgcJ n=1 Tax=Hafnia alvei TaxID=569 RepID=UPI001F3E9FE5|nr:diguanylate cyclase DgcJ [Hafnia alvei]MCE9871575.1 GGDEF domain-containing protein [Hafnia alvei]